MEKSSEDHRSIYSERGCGKKSGKSTSNYLNDERNYVIIFGSELESKDEPL